MKEELYTWSKDGMKMKINTKFKLFNRQTNCITSGNALCNTQYSNYIRPYNETNCNGNVFEKGHLQNYDLQYFHLEEHTALKEYVKSFDHSVVLYEFFIYKNKQKDVRGWLVEDNGEIIHMVVNASNPRVNYEKRYDALILCQKIIEKTNEKINGRRN